MKKTLTLATILLMAAGLAWAQCPMGQGQGEGPKGGPMMEQGGMKGCGNSDRGMGRGQWWENPGIVKELGLTDDQANKIDDLTLKHRTAMIKMEADLKIAHLEMQDMAESDAGDSDIKNKSKAIGSLRQKIEDARLEHMLGIRKLLSAEQQKKLKSLRPMMRKQRMMMDCCPEGQETPQK